MGWGYYGGYDSVAKKKEKAAKQIEKLRKTDVNVSPVVIRGNKIAKTWWGEAWCKNLESYADLRNRIGRGSAYVKNGFVIDLRIHEGLVTAKVMGSSLYRVNITIDILSERRKNDIIKAVGRRIDSVSDLIDGKFPKDLGELFLTQGNGLFPAPHEIHKECDCPDWADMCKHVAAVLYGVGARLDENPLLFFMLRGIDVNAFIKASIDEKVGSLMRNAGKITKRVIKDADISEIFGL